MKIAVTYENEEIFQHFGGARIALDQAGIKLYPGAAGNADRAVDAFLKGSLDYDPDTMCNHHHEGGEHSCHGHGGTCGH